MPDYWLTPEDIRACEVLNGDVGVWDGVLPIEPGLRFSGDEVSAAIVFGIAERRLDEFERR